MANKEEKKCTNPELNRDLKEPVCEFLDALEKQLLAQKEAGYPVDQALENLKKSRKILSKILK